MESDREIVNLINYYPYITIKEFAEMLFLENYYVNDNIELIRVSGSSDNNKKKGVILMNDKIVGYDENNIGIVTKVPSVILSDMESDREIVNLINYYFPITKEEFAEILCSKNVKAAIKKIEKK
jgi:hypothetical protein